MLVVGVKKQEELKYTAMGIMENTIEILLKM